MCERAHFCIALYYRYGSTMTIDNFPPMTVNFSQNNFFFALRVRSGSYVYIWEKLTFLSVPFELVNDGSV